MEARLDFRGLGQGARNFPLRLLAIQIFRYGADGFPYVRDDLSGLTVSFTGIGKDDWLQLEDLATLALVIRAVAMAGKQVRVRLPDFRNNEPTRVQRLLEHLGFLDLFSGIGEENEWEERVDIQGKRHHFSLMPHSGGLAHYIQMRWFDVAQFAYKKETDIWRERPHVARIVEEEFREALHARGMVDPETINLLCNTVFLELGWNVVLHSGERPGSGIGVFCGQVTFAPLGSRPEPPKLTFCVIDSGKGIPNTLRKVYRTLEDERRLPHIIEGISEDTAIIRFALEPSSTSRPQMPSNVDREGFRGLATVATALQDVGRMRIRSAGGTVNIEGHVEGTRIFLDDTLKDAPIFGTQIIGTLQRKRRLLEPRKEKPVKLPIGKLSINLVCDFEGQCSNIANDEAAETFGSIIDTASDIVVFDIGYSDINARNLEYLCAHVLSENRGKWMFFWNVCTPWTQFGHLEKILKEHCDSGGLPPLFVRGDGDSKLIGAAGSPNSTMPIRVRSALQNLLQDGVNENDVRWTVLLTSEDFVKMNNEINSHYLASGFKAASAPGTDIARITASGFFVGRIHLLRGHEIRRYFSLTRNLTFARDANLRRWTEACAAAVNRLLDRTPSAAESRLVLLGFTGTVRELVARVFARLERPLCRAYMLLTFDIPTREEIASKIHRDDQVILVTDVISTGTLAEAIHSLVSRVGAQVLGVVSLVDTRRQTTDVESMITLGRSAVPLITCGQLREAGDREGSDELAEYWVDPVSLIPSSEKNWGWSANIDDKIETTLDLIREANAALCGHIVDGTRHISLYIDLRKLLEERDLLVQEQIRRVCLSRLKTHRWRAFQPTAVFYPSGISRIESVSAKPRAGEIPVESLTVYQTAVTTYIDRLRKVFPQKRLIAVEVQRAFDPGGGSRCARTVELPRELEGNLVDVIIADDGIWKGITVAALTQIAISLGAQRVLVAPLLARISPTEVEQLELLQSVRSTRGSRKVDVCYAFPMLLPVPYYGVQECPYEITVNRIRDRSNGFPAIAEIAAGVIATLEGHTPTDCPVHSPEYCDMWTRLRTYVELASEHEHALEKLRTLIERAKCEEGLLALFSLFTEEWRLLGRARLRQAIWPTLRQRAVEVALAPGTRSDVRIAALTALRSLFKEAFVDHLTEIADLANQDIAVLGRVVLQASTLSEPLRHREECVRFFEKISDWSPATSVQNADEAQLISHFKLISACKVFSLELRTAAATQYRSPRTAAIELRDILQQSPPLLHKTRIFFEILAGNSPETLRELDSETFNSYFRQWKSEHEPLLSREVVPRLKSIQHLLLRSGTEGHQIVSRDFRFLESDSELLNADIGAIPTGLSMLRSFPKSMVYGQTVIEASQRLLARLVGRNSTTLNLLEKLRAETVGYVVANFESAIVEHFSTRSQDVTVKVDGIERTDPKALIFAPPDVIAACTGNILANLLTHAFPASSSGDLLVTLRVEERRNENGEPLLTIRVLNNGRAIKSDVTMNVSGKRAASDLLMFDGSYALPQHTEEVPWSVVQSVSFLLW